jgi:hypothetical protein
MSWQMHITNMPQRHHLGDLMQAVARNSRKLIHVILSILAGLLALTAMKDRVLADQIHTFVIPADDGYGVKDCIAKDQGCAEVVASAWCKAHGLSGPLAYGRAEDLATGSIAAANANAAPQPAKLDPDAFVITCKD